MGAALGPAIVGAGSAAAAVAPKLRNVAVYSKEAMQKLYAELKDLVINKFGDPNIVTYFGGETASIKIVPPEYKKTVAFFYEKPDGTFEGGIHYVDPKTGKQAIHQYPLNTEAGAFRFRDDLKAAGIRAPIVDAPTLAKAADSKSPIWNDAVMGHTTRASEYEDLNLELPSVARYAKKNPEMLEVPEEVTKSITKRASGETPATNLLNPDVTGRRRGTFSGTNELSRTEQLSLTSRQLEGTRADRVGPRPKREDPLGPPTEDLMPEPGMGAVVVRFYDDGVSFSPASSYAPKRSTGSYKLGDKVAVHESNGSWEGVVTQTGTKIKVAPVGSRASKTVEIGQLSRQVPSLISGGSGPPIKFSINERVYFGSAKGKDTSVGVILRQDPRKPGNWLVQENPGNRLGPELEGEPRPGGVRIRSYPENELFPTQIPGVAKMDSLTPNPVEAPIPPQLGELPPVDIEATALAAKVVRQGARKGPGFVQRLERQLLNGRFRGPKDMERAVREAQSSSDFQHEWGKWYERIRKSFPDEKLFNEFDRDLASIAEARNIGNGLSLDLMRTKYGERFAQGEQFITQVMRDIDILDKRIAQLGGIPEDFIRFREDGTMDAYLTRQYLAHIMPKGKWAKIAPADAINDAAEFLLKQKHLADRFWTHDQIINELHSILKSDDPFGTFLRSPVGKSYKHLEKRGDVPGPIRKLLGEVDSGMARLAMTVANQRAIVANLEAWDHIRKHVDPVTGQNDWFSSGPRGDLHPEPIPDDPKRFGKAAGGFVKEEIYNALVPQAEARAGPALALWQSLVGLRKGHMVSPTAALSLRPFINSTVGGMYSGIISGGLELYRPIKTGREFRHAFKALRDYAKDPSGRTGLGATILEMRRFGADWGNNWEKELRDGGGSKFFRDVAKHFDELPEHAPISEYISRMRQAYQRFVVDPGSNLLDFGDRIFRIQSYVSLREKFLKQAGKMGLSGNDALVYAAQNASDRVNWSFFNAAHTAPIVEKTRRNVPTFLTSVYDDFRTNAMLGKRLIAREGDKYYDPDLKWKLAGNLLFMGAMYGASMELGGYGVKNLFEDFRRNQLLEGQQRATGEISRDKGLYTKSQRTYRPVIVPLPYKTKDSEGAERWAFLDVTQFHLINRLMTGHPDDNLFGRIISNAFTSPIDDTQLGIGMRNAAEAAGLLRGVNSPFKLLEGEADLVRGLDVMSRAGALPRGIHTLLETGRQTGMTDAIGPIGRHSERMTPGQAGARLIVPIMPTPGAESLEQELLREFNSLKNSKGTIVKNPNRSDESVEKLMKARERRMEELSNQVKE
jgi:hypothetical protein